MDFIIVEVTERIMAKQNSILIAGFNAIEMNISNLANAVCRVFNNTTEGKPRVLK